MGSARRTQRITKRTVDAIEPGDLVFDSAVTGFAVRCQKRAKVYVVKTRVAGRQRWFSIGRHGAPWTPEAARTEAQRLLGLIADNKDPAEMKADAEKNITVAELCDLYMAEGVATKKASTLAMDRSRIESHVKPLLGRQRIGIVTRAHVERFMLDVANGKTAKDEKRGFRKRAIVRGGKGVATRTVGLLGAIFTFAERRALIASNPCRGVKRFPDGRSERFLAPAELARLGETLAAAEQGGVNPNAIAAVRLLVLTGCRKNEILSLKWEYIDWDRACLRLPDSKTGAKVVTLGAPALELLSSLPRIEGNPYVLPATTEARYFIGLQKVWEGLREKADLHGVRLHDLRHSFASVGMDARMGLPIVGKLLGQRDPKSTARYAHIADDPAKIAADSIAGTIAAAMNGENGDGAKVVELPRKA